MSPAVDAAPARAGGRSAGRARAEGERPPLGNNARNPSEATSGQEKVRARRAERYRLRRWLWEQSGYGRTVACGRTLRTLGDPTLRLSGEGQDARAGVAGMVTCGQRTCTVCGPKIGAKWATQIADTLREHRDTVYSPDLVPYGLGGGHAVMVTLTMAHSLRSVLVFLLATLMYAWSKVTTGAGYVRDAQEFGIVGWIRALEIPWSRRNGFHPHLHILFLTSEPMSADRAWEFGWRLFGRWEAALNRRGARVLAEYGLDVRLCDLDDTSTGALGDYLTKVSYEVAGDHLKSARVADSYTIHGLIAEAAETFEVEAFSAWCELESTLAGRRRRFVDFSKGARELRRRAGHREMTEREMAEEDLKGDDVLALDREAWPTLVIFLEELLHVAESQGVVGAKAWLTARGIGFRDIAPAPRRRLKRRPARAPRPPTGPLAGPPGRPRGKAGAW